MEPVVPETIGLSSARLERAYKLLEAAVQARQLPAAALLVARHGVPLEARGFGHQYLTDDAPATQPDTIFLVASITKPVTATAIMLLLEQGKVTLDEPVAAFVPEFGQQDKEPITIRHLLSHTSGLPDMLPDNVALRQQHAPLAEFVRRIYAIQPEFMAGSNIQYQSCGTAILGEIVERIAGVSLPDFMRREIFEPLGMTNTALGATGLPTERIAHINVEPDMQDTDWGWNSPYWWHLGVPWGGMFSTVGDIFRFCQMFLNGGKLGDVQLLSPATVAAMCSDQTGVMPLIPAATKVKQQWGLGWRLKSPFGWQEAGNLISAKAFGHSGATGTVAWVDPERHQVCVLFTTQPLKHSSLILARCSNLVAAAAMSD